MSDANNGCDLVRVVDPAVNLNIISRRGFIIR